MKKIIFLIVAVALIIILSQIYSKNTSTNNPLKLIDMSMNMESDLNVKDVMISEITGDILEIRLKNPENVLEENLSVGTAYIFGYIEPSIINTKIKKVRVIYTINSLDNSVFEASLSDITNWKNKKITDDDFAKKIKFINLLKK